MPTELTSNNSAGESPRELGAEQPSLEERRALIQRLAGYDQISRSARLQSFLHYVGKQSLKDGCPEISEEEIGTRVFGRPASYDRGQDNIVRVNATELRKRIELYFATVGAHESLIFEMPRGGYKLIFLRRFAQVQSGPATSLTDTPLTDSAPAELHLPVQVSRHALAVLWAAGTLLVAFAIGCAVLYQQNRALQRELHPWQSKPALAAFWADFLNSPRAPEIILPDASLSLSKEITQHPVTLNEFLDHSYVTQIQSSDLSPDRKADLISIFNHHPVMFGDVRAAQLIIALDPLFSPFHLTFSRFQTADAFNWDNTILIGGKTDNPWVYLFDKQMNFDLNNSGAIVNHNPRPGEQAAYEGSYTQEGETGYSVVAYLPNPSRTGSTIIIAGTGSEATTGGAEFFTSENQLEKLQNALHTDRFPYFEVLLKTSQIRGTSFNAEIVAYRVYPRPH